MILVDTAVLPRNPNVQSLVTVANTQATVTANRMQSYFNTEDIKCKIEAHQEFENKVIVIPEVSQEISVAQMAGKLRFTNKVTECCCSEFRAKLEGIINRFI